MSNNDDLDAAFAEAFADQQALADVERAFREWNRGNRVTYHKLTRREDWAHCTKACEATQECTACGRMKKPIGRSAPLAAANGLCDHECPGYMLTPEPGHLWPGELARLRNE